MNDDVSFDKLRTIAEGLPNFNPGEIKGNILKLDVERGRAISEGVFNNGTVAICMLTMMPDSLILAHKHEELELVTVLEGDLTIFQEETKKEYISGEWFIIAPNKAHKAFSEKGCLAKIETIPAGRGFPKGKEYGVKQ